MAYPSSLDSFTSPTANQKLNSPSHSAIETAQNTAASAIETKLGVDSSAVATSIDYLLKNTSSIDPGHKHTAGTGLTATGSKDATTFLRGDNTWVAINSIVVSPEVFGFMSTGSSANALAVSGYCDATQFSKIGISGTTFAVSNSIVTGVGPQQRDIATDWGSAAVIKGCTTLGVYIYILTRDSSNNFRVYRFSQSNIGNGGTLMTFSGQTFNTTGGTGPTMACDGTNFYFNNKAGNSANDYIVSKYTLSGTTFTYVSDITCGSTANTVNIIVSVDSSVNIWGSGTADNKIRKFNSSGTLQATSSGTFSTTGGPTFMDWAGVIYQGQTADTGKRAEKILLP